MWTHADHFLLKLVSEYYGFSLSVHFLYTLYLLLLLWYIVSIICYTLYIASIICYTLYIASISLYQTQVDIHNSIRFGSRFNKAHKNSCIRTMWAFTFEFRIFLNGLKLYSQKSHSRVSWVINIFGVLDF